MYITPLASGVSGAVAATTSSTNSRPITTTVVSAPVPGSAAVGGVS